MSRSPLAACLTVICAIVVSETTSTASALDRVIDDFDTPARSWQAVNDGVMGGRSSGRYARTSDGVMIFSGNLSLANNGGFASVRSQGQRIGLENDDIIVARVKGDGRKYTFNLYTPDRRMAFSYRTEFSTTSGQWMEVYLPVRQFQATSFGRRVNQPLDASRVTGVGILLGDKKAGPFQLEIDSIKIVGE